MGFGDFYKSVYNIGETVVTTTLSVADKAAIIATDATNYVTNPISTVFGMDPTNIGDKVFGDQNYIIHVFRRDLTSEVQGKAKEAVYGTVDTAERRVGELFK